MRSKINWVMVVMTILGGVIAFVLGEILLDNFQYKLWDSVLMGLYFGILSLCVGGASLLAETIHTKINSTSWRDKYIWTSIKFLIPCTLVVTFLIAAIFQYIYEFSFNKNKVINDVVVLMDTSSSMAKTDPKNERFNALKNLLDSMNSGNRIAVFEFNDNTQKIQGMDKVTSEVKDNINKGLETYKTPSGRTNMREALDKAVSEIDNSSSKAMVIMLSDGGDNYDLNSKFEAALKPYRDKNIPVYTVGVSNQDDFYMLKRIASETGGSYYNVKDVSDLKNAFITIYRDVQHSLLNDKRNGIYSNSLFYGFLRIFFVTFIAIIISAGVSFVLDNKYTLKGFILGGIVSGIIAGLILEVGFRQAAWNDVVYRFFADVIISFMFTLFSGEGERKLRIEN